MWPVSHPATGAAQKIRDPETSVRIGAIHDLERFALEDPDVVIPALGVCLRDAVPGVRAAAAIALGVAVPGARGSRSARPDVSRAIVVLFNGVNDRQADVRASFLQALWMIASSEDAAAPVVNIERVKAVLVTAAADPEDVVRRAAILGLGATGPKGDDDPPMVLSGALEDPSERVRVAAAESLVRFRRRLHRVLPDLVRSFEKARPEARQAYTIVLERIRPRAFMATATLPALVSALASADDEIRCLAATALAAFGEDAHPAIPALVSSIIRPGRQRGPDPAEGMDPVLSAARAILQITPENALDRKTGPPLDSESLRALASVLRSARPQIRVALAASLGRFRPTRAVIPVLADAVQDPDEAVRAAALQALHDIGNAVPFVPPIAIGAALEDESPQVRYWAAGALGHAGLGIDPYVPALLRHAERDSDRNVRAVCALELREFIKPPAVTSAIVPVLIEALNNPDEQVRCAACGMLAGFRTASAEAIPAVIRLFRQSCAPPYGPSDRIAGHEQQAWTATALGKIAPGTPWSDQAASVLMEALRARTTSVAPIAVIHALAHFGPRVHGAIPRLRELQHSPNTAVSQTAREVLAILEDSD
jgi:HEAT repeat protein